MNQSAEKDAARTTIAEAIAAWEAKGPTSLTAALMADALYGIRELADEWERIGRDGLPHLGCLDMYRHLADELRATRPIPPANPEPGDLDG